MKDLIIDTDLLDNTKVIKVKKEWFSPSYSNITSHHLLIEADKTFSSFQEINVSMGLLGS
ncbi:hypothetical protein EDC55_11342 [Allofrancisella inopinata]|uniref:Uncharacterized protein n=1 Tax=Allofrancisella inopinata TaxID=1085647 RepID=A0AAE6YGP5_9GAMM|nr:hypothetical protein [Allofrancisella inopinata]QIV95590.1 hypothetical protein E4K63_01545 [Allofrancisella inopinata]TDT70721.1 hypothetical protein EDC55_11342 [Allofrancisella inopinata]